MGFGPWAIVLIAGVAAGAATCAGLVTPRRYLAWTGLAGTFTAALLVYGNAGVWRLAGRPDALVAAGLLGLGAAIGGYALASTMLPALTRPHADVPTLVTAPDDGAVHVILLADAEHEEYRPGDLTRTLDLYELSEVPLPPYATRPLVYASEQSRYRRAGGSGARRTVRDVAAALSARPGDETPSLVDVAFCDGGPSLALAIADIASRGGRRIVVAALTVAWTRSFDGAIGDAQALEMRRTGVEIAVTDPLWASHGIAAAAAGRALAAFGDHGLGDGVVLVSAGNPWQWDRHYPAAAEQSTFFAQRVRAELIEAGIPAERIRRAWLDWEQPDVPEAVRHLAALGALHVALMPVDFLFETLGATVDLPLVAEQASFETGIRVEVVPPLGDDPALISALRMEITRASLSLDTAAASSSPGTARG